MATLFLRNDKNQTIVDCEILKDDISCSIDIRYYTLFLLKLKKHLQLEFMNDMDAISEIRGSFHEFNPKKLNSNDFVRNYLGVYAKKWQLFLVED